ncbi:MFS transporter [Angustibacter sp. Root456]|uniref:MFS transporter n=1 Tax=Angustibacter sp. Root456 TaxID=1736539 RepID=UPI001F3B5E60|nr:MFS transporter [Angustibacter sp. Root456]
MATATIDDVSTATRSTSRPSLSSLWHDLPREGRLLLSTVIVDALGIGFVLPFGVVYLHEVRHLSLTTVGLLLAVPSTVALALLGPIGAVIDRYGPRRLQMLALVANLLGSALLAFATSAASAAVAFGLLGLGQAVFWPASQSLVAAVIPPAIRQRYYGTSFTVLNLGIGVGGLASGLFVSTSEPWTFQVIYLLNAVSFLAPLCVLALPLRHVGNAVQHHADADEPAPAGSYRAVLSDRAFRRFLVVVFFGAFVGYAQFEAGWTAYARTVAEASTKLIGIAFAVNTATIVVLQLIVIQRIEGHRRTRVLMLMSLVWAASWSLMGLAGLVPGSVVAGVLLSASMAVFALGETFQSPVVPAITNDLAPAHLRGRYNAVGSMVFQVAAIGGPVVAGFLLGHHLTVPFVAVLLVGCALMVVVLGQLERVIPDAANGVGASAEPAQGAAVTVPAQRERATTPESVTC